ncbi:DUF3943 domain-containing protein [Foetidibacter luteolus]|uniref:DUF3943 domain-containing protein n=1 Tax=Foetidibacter luteolus TaxID=2608880 RepID=UPI00129AD92A|nr:DUF3943 domain-containing protein [Foetidibacter luteolus]
MSNAFTWPAYLHFLIYAPVVKAFSKLTFTGMKNIVKFAPAKKLLTVLLVFVTCTCQAQNNNTLITDSALQAPTDTFYVKKHFWRASGELLVTQLVPWSYNYFIRNADFAKISFKSIGHNLKPGSWEWDDNNFKTNQFAHPYHGNLYYNSFRSNGYNFWQAAPAAFAGSLLWEIAGETHPPAPNDFVNTSIGGIALGEMTYRLSNAVIDNRQRGFKRQAQEVLGFIINPVSGLTRILDGRWGKVHYHPDDTVKTKLSGILDIGGRRFSEQGEDFFERGDNEFYMRLRLRYGNLYEATKTPFSNFSVFIEAGASDSAYLNTVLVNAALRQWLAKERPDRRHFYALTMNYDYFNNASFEYGAQSSNFKILSEWRRLSKTKLFSNLGAGVIVLAAVPDDYLYYGEGRNYDYGPGISVSGGIGLVANDKFLAAVNYRGGWFLTVNGNESSFFLNAVTTELRYQFTPRLSVGMELGHFSLNGYYADYKDVSKRYPFARYSIGYRLFGERD